MADSYRFMFGRDIGPNDSGAFFLGDIADCLETLEGLYQEVSFRNRQQGREEETAVMDASLGEIEHAFAEYRAGMETAATAFVNAYFDFVVSPGVHDGNYGFSRELAFNLVAFELMITMRDELEDHVRAYLREVMEDLEHDPIV